MYPIKRRNIGDVTRRRKMNIKGYSMENNLYFRLTQVPYNFKDELFHIDNRAVVCKNM